MWIVSYRNLNIVLLCIGFILDLPAIAAGGRCSFLMHRSDGFGYICKLKAMFYLSFGSNSFHKLSKSLRQIHLYLMPLWKLPLDIVFSTVFYVDNCLAAQFLILLFLFLNRATPSFSLEPPHTTSDMIIRLGRLTPGYFRLLQVCAGLRMNTELSQSATWNVELGVSLSSSFSLIVINTWF